LLKLTTEPTFTAPVVIPTPWGKQTIKMVFKYKNAEQYEEYIKKESTESRKNEDVIMEIASDWQEVDGEFNAENIAKLCNAYHQAAGAIVKAYIETNCQSRLEN